MSQLTRLLEQNVYKSSLKAFVLRSRQLSSHPEEDKSYDDEEFRVLNLRSAPVQRQQRKVYKKDVPQPPRTNLMHVDQDWPSVWPGPRTFHPASVPLPLRQGYTEKNAAPPSKFGNAELMKIPNFLHLTPPAISRQCEALKKFCTPWPKNLENAEKWEKHFPIEIDESDYCHALPTIRHPDARKVTLKIKLSNLKFDKHSKDKFLRLVGDRYNPNTDILTIQTDRCPTKKQNYDYAQYLLTACYHESFEIEDWEASKSLADMEVYEFENNKSKLSAENILNWGGSEEGKKKPSAGFAKSVEDLINEGENHYNLAKYKEESKKLLGLK